MSTLHADPAASDLLVPSSDGDPRPVPLPPHDAMVAMGSGDAESFRSVGDRVVGKLVRQAGLTAWDRVLDLGCGVGRLAIPLTDVLAPRPDGRPAYVGTDCSAEAVAWCRREISPRHPHFWFRRVDARNGRYNPSGSIDPDQVRIADPDASYDVAAVVSVFTHTDVATVEGTLGELYRVLRPGGRALVSWYLVTPEAARDLRALERFPLAPLPDGSWARDPADPEELLAHDADRVLARVRDLGFVVGRHSVAKWANLDRPRVGQDFAVLHKPVTA